MKAKKGLDQTLVELKEVVLKKYVKVFSYRGDGLLRYQDGLREKILSEVHSSRYSIHPGATKMNHELQEIYWWNGIKKDTCGIYGSVF